MSSQRALPSGDPWKTVIYCRAFQLIKVIWIDSDGATFERGTDCSPPGPSKITRIFPITKDKGCSLVFWVFFPSFSWPYECAPTGLSSAGGNPSGKSSASEFPRLTGECSLCDSLANRKGVFPWWVTIAVSAGGESLYSFPRSCSQIPTSLIWTRIRTLHPSNSFLFLILSF